MSKLSSFKLQQACECKLHFILASTVYKQALTIRKCMKGIRCNKTECMVGAEILNMEISHENHLQRRNLGCNCQDHSLHKEKSSLEHVRKMHVASSNSWPCYPGSSHPGTHPLVAWKTHHQLVEQPVHNQKNPHPRNNISCIEHG